MEQEQEENICDDVIYADPGRRSRSRPNPRGVSPGYAHRVEVPLRGVTTWGCSLHGGLSPASVEMYNIWRVVSEAYALPPIFTDTVLHNGKTDNDRQNDNKQATCSSTNQSTYKSAQKTNKLLCPRGTQTCALAVANIKVNGNGKVILDTHPESDQHQN